ncbi:hypothetical protein FNF29_02449 [Cafeteria roenbergensis]|uniref:type II protein arginine methyltransferase n=1 Tax=Cafeteria roenbergensis TaxID=33653 RepID=A0A5A8CNG5_CAFRO|nr:hypothetical protein FNF29_02449 [Cafeteria roenbergensis]|eukprot:KAA0154572.1 hypothetical protein FNF29_02449 [Cafeteria roenbergensis]
MRPALAVRRAAAPARRASVAAALRLSASVRCSSGEAAAGKGGPSDAGRWVDIRVDTTGLAGRDAKAKDVARARGEIPDNSATKSELSPLGRELKSLILARGPLSIAEFMRQALLHPVHGYYMREDADVFGRRGDFVTSPEVTQVFGELIGVWLVAMWHQLGSPPLVRIVEMGPGLGTLMRDALRAASRFPGFYAGASVHMVEASPALRRKQAEALACTEFTDAGPGVGAAGSGAAVESMRCGIGGGTPCSPVSGPTITWHGHVSDVPKDGAFLCVAHELFDALPVHQIERTARGWRERLVEVDDDEGGHHFRLALARCETPASRYFTDVHPLSAPKHVPDDDPSLAVWRLRPGAPPARLDGLERELGLAPADGSPATDAAASAGAAGSAAAAAGGTRAALQGVRAGRDGIGALRRAMGKGGGGPKSPMAAAREKEELPERRAEEAVTEQRRRQLETLERDMRDEARRAGVDVDAHDAEVRAESAARAASAIRTSAERVEHMTRHVASKRAAALRAAATPAAAEGTPKQGAPAAASAPAAPAAGSGGMGFLKGLRPKAASAPAAPAKAASSDLTPSLAQIADEAAAQHRELEREGRLQDIARAAIRGRTVGDLEREAASSPPGSSAAAGEAPAAAAASTNGWLEEAEVGSVVEFSPQSCVLAAELSARVGEQGGAALIIDYGNDFAPESTVRGIRDHAFTSFLERPGDTDVTADVDFRGLRHAADVGHPGTASVGPVPQGEFLQRMGIRERTQAALDLLVAQEAEEAERRGDAKGGAESAAPAARAVDGSDLSAAERLVAAVERIVNPDSGMGGIYKAMAIVPKSMTAGHGVPGFPSPDDQAAPTRSGERA